MSNKNDEMKVPVEKSAITCSPQTKTLTTAAPDTLQRQIAADTVAGDRGTAGDAGVQQQETSADSGVLFRGSVIAVPAETVPDVALDIMLPIIEESAMDPLPAPKRHRSDTPEAGPSQAATPPSSQEKKQLEVKVMFKGQTYIFKAQHKKHYVFLCQECRIGTVRISKRRRGAKFGKKKHSRQCRKTVTQEMSEQPSVFIYMGKTFDFPLAQEPMGYLRNL